MEFNGSMDGHDQDDQRGIKRKRSSAKIGVHWQPGGGPDDYFFVEVPNWTVSNALSRLLTKVRNNPNRTITIQKFIKDSCKGNLKTYFETVRDSMGRGDSVVMAEIAYRSFIQLTTGDKPLLLVYPPKSKPRTRAAAISPEGYAYKDYIVQVTETGFAFMGVKPVYEDTASPPRKQRKLTQSPSSPQGLMDPMPLALGQGNPKHHGYAPFVSLITEQEQDIANNAFLYFKASVDGLLASIVHLRNENQALQKENMEYGIVNNTLQADYNFHKKQMIKLSHLILQYAGQEQQQQQQNDHVVEQHQTMQQSDLMHQQTLQESNHVHDQTLQQRDHVHSQQHYGQFMT